MPNSINALSNLFSGTNFVSGPMVYDSRRDTRLDTARTNAARCEKELRKDRKDLEKKERELMTKIRNLERRGEHYKARVVAGQIAQYRAIGDRNFEAETLIQTRAQVMVSDHKVNRAEVEAIKGIKHANLEENHHTVGRREYKYAARMNEYEDMEVIMNSGMDDIYDEAEEAKPKFKHVNSEVDSILREVFSGKKECYDRKPTKFQAEKKISLKIKKFEHVFNSTSTLNLNDLNNAANEVARHHVQSRKTCPSGDFESENNEFPPAPYSGEFPPRSHSNRSSRTIRSNGVPLKIDTLDYSLGIKYRFNNFSNANRYVEKRTFEKLGHARGI
ncbi:hypothetical protein HK099_003384 [Clydaea vesicula]|uniref:Uncharacterized protein n=1 Tax=Clydaea vesicula TaxID=447962 RepID=A0AAD5Y0B4_9FUNG|nr:hypothetical protein HK099_003384 [Clydaea vesicula]